MSGYQGNPPPPYAGNPPAGYAPPPGYAPHAGYAPPPAGYAPSPGGYAPPPAGYAPPPAGFAPPPGGYPPANPYPTGTAPPPEAAPYYPTSGYVSPPAPSSTPGRASVVGDATPRRYFYIVSQMHGKVLDVEGGSHSPGTKVIMYPRNSGAADNQLWYLDESGVIHSKLTGFVLQDTIGGISLQKPTNHPGQMWTISGNRIVLKNNPNTCLDIIGEEREDCARLCQYQYKGSANQHWTFQYLPPRYFVIRSALNGKVLDVEAENRSPGARVIMWPRKSPLGANQLWYLDEQSIIRSKLNNFTLQPGAGGIVLTPYSNQQNQQWTIRGRAIVLQGSPNKCLDIHSASHADGATLCLYAYAKSPNQQWFYDYV